MPPRFSHPKPTHKVVHQLTATWPHLSSYVKLVRRAEFPRISIKIDFLAPAESNNPFSFFFGEEQIDNRATLFTLAEDQLVTRDCSEPEVTV